MPLQIEVEAEHPEVVALKKKVKEVAQTYTSRHGWCREVKAALREAGIEDSRNIHVEVTFSVAGSDEQKSIVKFPVEDLAGKTDDEQKQLVADKIAPKVMVAGTQVTIPVTVVDLNESDQNALARQGLEYPDAYMHFYISDGGRVAHLSNKPRSVLDGNETVAEYFSGRRGRGAPIHALCGEVSYGPVTHSARSENRICGNCSRRVGS